MTEIRAFGHLEIRGASGQPMDALLAQPKRVALLVHLALSSRQGMVRRDTILGLFWPDHSQSRARGSLRQALYALRQDLGEDAIVTRGDEDVRVNDDIVRCDAVRFEHNLSEGNLAAAVELYAGPLLNDFYLKGSAEFAQWVDGERDRLARLYGRALEDLADEAALDGNMPMVVEWCRRLAMHNPYSTRVALRYMKALQAAGDRAGALAYAQRHAVRLHEDLEAAPSPDVKQYAEKLRRRPERRLRHSSGANDTVPPDDRSQEQTVGRRGEFAARKAAPATVESRSAPSIVAPRTPTDAAPQRKGLSYLLPWSVAAVSTGVAVWALAVPRSEIVSHGIARFDLVLPDSAPIALESDGVAGSGQPVLDVARAGDRIVYVAAVGPTTQLYLRDLAQSDFVALPNTEGAHQPFFSPDGNWVGFFSEGRVKKTSLLDGAVVLLGTVSDPRGAVWRDEDRIVVAVPSGHLAVATSGSGSIDSLETAGLWPDLLPDGRTYLVSSDRGIISVADGRVHAGDQDNVIVRGGVFPRYLASGHFVYSTPSGLFVAPFDSDGLRISSRPVPVREQIRIEQVNGVAQFAVSDDGMLVYAARTSDAERPPSRHRLVVVENWSEEIRRITGGR